LIQIKTALKQLSNKITDDDLRPLLQKWTHTRTLKRFEHLSNYGEIESMLYFIIKGSFRTYITHKDKEEVEVFGFPNNFCCSYVSFLTQQPALHQLQALSKSEVIGIKRADFYTAIHNNWNLENFCRRQTEQLIINRVERALLLRSYIVQNDQEYCDVLRGPNEIYCDYVSFLTQQPGRYYLQALSNAELIGISRENHRQLGEDNWNIERVWRLETEKLFIYRTARDHILRLAAKDRIKHLLFIRPALFQHIPHKYIASYLRMTPETFSREIATLTGL